MAQLPGTRAMPGRATRGRRMAAMVGEEAEADAEFWGQAAFQEAEDDADFDSAAEEEPPDEVDSDFDAEEAPPDATFDPERAARSDEHRAAARASKRKRRYVDPATKPKPRQPTTPRPSPRPRHTPSEPHEFNVDKASLRRSTKQASASSEKTRQQRAAEEEERRKVRERQMAKRTVERPPTQQELLRETHVTEKKNLEDLRQLLKLEEEKKRPPPQRETTNGPHMRFVSRAGVQTLSFSSLKAVPALYTSQHIQSGTSPEKLRDG